MHMSDALISPVVGGVMWAAAAGAAAYSVRKINRENLVEGKKVPLMGVMGAFVFAAQMLNFTIPATGSSGHIGGGLLLAAMLGPEAGFLTIAVILAIQALFFADGGLLAMGCNIVNMGLFSCLVAFPLIFKPMLRKGAAAGRITLASVVAAVAGLQLGAFAVVLQTLLSGRTELPFGTFALLMQPIHLAIGAVEGLITAAVLVFMHRVAPESVTGLEAQATSAGMPRKAVAIIAALALLCGGILSWFASTHPDGLEWSMFKTAGEAELVGPAGIHDTLGEVQDATAFLPDYDFKGPEPGAAEDGAAPAWPAVSGGTSVAGVVGSAITLALAGLVGLLLVLPRRRKKRAAA